MSDDRDAIRELVENWVVWRDAGDWERFATVWHDDGFDDGHLVPGPRGRLHPGQPRGLRARRADPPLPRRHTRSIAGDRAISQTKMTISAAGRGRRRRMRRRLHGPLLRLPRAARRALGARAAPADLREGPARPGRSRGRSELDARAARRFPSRLPPPRLRADADRVRRQARHAGPGRSGRRARSTAAVPEWLAGGRDRRPLTTVD